MHRQFPFLDLARVLLPFAFDHREGAHDEGHLLRVWRNVETISASEGGNHEILMVATLLHDCIWVDKASPERPMASRLAARQAQKVLTTLGWDEGRIGRVCHAIEAHSFSAGITPTSLEAEILQDADRLDAMGFIGVARCFYLAGSRGAAILHPTDPEAESRALDESAFALDHFRVKLLRLGEGFRTNTGRALAQARAADLRHFYEGLLAEVG